MIEVDLHLKLARFALDARFASAAGVTALYGRSGAGKTTIVNAIAGLLRPDSGTIVIDGVRLYDSARGIAMPVAQRRVGYVFQEGRLFPHLTVRGNLHYGYDLTPPGKRYVEMEHMIELLGLNDLLERRPAKLSGGEKQRVAIGRALLASPRVLLLDEPLAALDAVRKDEILQYVERLHAEIRIPIVYVTHAVEEIVRLADAVVVMAGGKVVAQGAVDAVLGSAEFGAFAGGEPGSLIEATVVAHDPKYHLTTLSFGGGNVRVPLMSAAVGAHVRVRVRAADVALALAPPADTSMLNTWAGRIVAIGEAVGASVSVRLDVGGMPLTARITRLSAERLALRPGLEVYALVKAVSLARPDEDRSSGSQSRPK